MTYFRTLCGWCGWLIREARRWDTTPDHPSVTLDVCDLCEAEVLARTRELDPDSWFPPDLGEAGA